MDHAEVLNSASDITSHGKQHKGHKYKPVKYKKVMKGKFATHVLMTTDPITMNYVKICLNWQQAIQVSYKLTLSSYCTVLTPSGTPSSSKHLWSTEHY